MILEVNLYNVLGRIEPDGETTEDNKRYDNIETAEAASDETASVSYCFVASAVLFSFAISSF